MTNLWGKKRSLFVDIHVGPLLDTQKSCLMQHLSEGLHA